MSTTASRPATLSTAESLSTIQSLTSTKVPPKKLPPSSSTSGTKTSPPINPSPVTPPASASSTSAKVTEGLAAIDASSRDFQKTGQKVGDRLSSLETLLTKAYGVGEGESVASLAKEAQALGLSVTDQTSLSGLQNALNIAYQAANRGMEMFMTMMRNRFEVMRDMVRRLDIR